MDIVANKFPGIRAVLPMSPDHAYQARHDDDANVLCFAADFMDDASAANIMKVFLSTPFAKEERYARRLQKIADIEEGSNSLNDYAGHPCPQLLRPRLLRRRK